MKLNVTLFRLVVLWVAVGHGDVRPLAAQSSPPNSAPAAGTTRVAVRPGEKVVLATAPCLVAVDPEPGAALEIARAPQGRSHAVFSAPPDPTSSPITVVIETGSGPAGDPASCEAPVRRRYEIAVEGPAPEVPPGALEQSFRILMAAFVLAVLLENAFALLFNWRLFLEFFVGKAWRTPIMFVGAWIVVRTFDLDLMAQLFHAYNPQANPRIGLSTWFTSAITAMVIAGGSVGVNRVLVALGFRSQLRPETLQPELEPTEAYVAIRVVGPASRVGARVDMKPEDETPAGAPTVLGFVGGSTGLRSRLVDLLFPVPARIPKSGGIRVSTKKAYRILVTTQDGKHYDAFGGPIDSPAESRPIAFAPRAIVDFVIAIPSPVKSIT